MLTKVLSYFEGLGMSKFTKSLEECGLKMGKSCRYAVSMRLGDFAHENLVKIQGSYSILNYYSCMSAKVAI